MVNNLVVYSLSCQPSSWISLVRPPYQADMAPYQANTHRYQAVSWRRETTLILTLQSYEINRMATSYCRQTFS